METSTYSSLACLSSVGPLRMRRNVNQVSKIALLEASWETPGGSRSLSRVTRTSKTHLLRQSVLNARHLPALSHGFDVAHEILRQTDAKNLRKNSFQQ